MTKKELYAQMLEFLRISLSSENDESVRTLARALTNYCVRDITIDPAFDDVVTDLISIKDAVHTVIMNIEQEKEY